jgi:hypothetical protein
MIAIKQLKSVLSSKEMRKTSDDFFKIHRYIEGYIKRVLVIGLRLNGVQYNNSVKIAESTYIKTAALIEKALILLNQSGNKQQRPISTLKNKYKELFILNNLFLEFTSPYRNRLAHGTIEILHDQELVNYLCHVDQSFYKEFENFLLNEFGYSAFDKPSAWGAKQGQPQQIKDTVKKLHLGSIVSEPLELSAVQKMLSNTSYAAP